MSKHVWRGGYAYQTLDARERKLWNKIKNEESIILDFLYGFDRLYGYFGGVGVAERTIKISRGRTLRFDNTEMRKAEKHIWRVLKRNRKHSSEAVLARFVRNVINLSNIRPIPYSHHLARVRKIMKETTNEV